MEHNKNLDGLRGIAASSVVVGHFYYALISTNPMVIFDTHTNNGLSILQKILTFLQFILIKIFSNSGHFAVILFFVLSGYVLTLPYYQGDLQTIQSRLWGRYLRLNIPIALVVFIAFLINIHGSIYDYVAMIPGIRWASSWYPDSITLLSTAKMALYESILKGNNTFNCSLWTLNIEFIGSIFLLSYYYIAPNKNRIITIFSLLFLLHVLFKENSIYYIAIVCGSLLINTSLSNIILKKLAIACFIILYFFVVIFDEVIAYSLPTLFSWDPINLYGTIAALSLVLAIKSGFGAKVLMSNIVQFLGKVSYPLYMLHILILFSISCYLYNFLPKTNLYIFINFVIYILLTLVCSSLFEKFIDKPAVDYSHAFGNWLYK